MPNPTPQPDIDELREKVEDYLDRADTEKVVNVGQFADEIITLLTTHTEKAVSAARIDELDNKLPKVLNYDFTKEQSDKVTKRINELEAELATISEGGEATND